MALEMVAGSVLSAFFDYLFQKMESPEVLRFFQGKELDEGILMKLKITMNTVSGLLDQAEEKQISVPAVKRWLDDLKHVAYQADDLLDEIAYEDYRSKAGAGSEKQKVFNFVSFRKVYKCIAGQRACSFISDRSVFDEEVVNCKLQEIHELIEHLLKQMNSLGFTMRKGIGEKLAPQQTTSLPEGSYDCDIRQSEKDSIMKSLLIDGRSVEVIRIEGQGGIGKTTLARQVYNDSSVNHTFDHKAWVYVSQEFKASKITDDIYGEVCSSFSKPGSQEKQQKDIQEKLEKKKFLLVLDDFWGAEDNEWNNLMELLKCGGKGKAKIIITSRNHDKKDVQKCVHLKKLSDEDCWKLIKQYAFADGTPSEVARFKSAGIKIAQKCGGLTLAAKIIGSLLRFKSSVGEWESISESNLWDLVGDRILPVLKLSYHFLPSHLKQCVAYCGIFPKGFPFSKELLIYLWIGEGFLLQSKSKLSVEELGSQYFDSLVSMSFFEQASGQDPGNEMFFAMHDMVHDLSKSVLGDFGFRLGDDDSLEVPTKARHLFVNWGYSYGPHDRINEVQFLRSFLLADFGVSSSIHDDKKTLHLLRNLKFLRVLYLERQWNMYKMPDFIGDLNHLRYLSLRRTSIRRLPESICRLYYLQILILWDCKDLIELPRDTRKLINLFCLDIRRTGLQDMPPHMGELAKLQTLTTFILGKNGRSRIKELKDMKKLKGELTIEIRQDFFSDRDASLCPELLNKLEFKWDVNSRDSDHENQLKGLHPHTKLENLSITDYKGIEFPDWLTGLSNLVRLKLSQCEKCSSLPPLGELASLKDLSIIGFDSVQSIGSKFYGRDPQQQPFRSLEFLRFDQMQNWHTWETKPGAFSKLKKLYLRGCQNLSKALPSDLPCLSTLNIQQCQNLVPTLPKVADNCDIELADGSRRMRLVKRSACWKYLSIRNSEVVLHEILKQMRSVSTDSLEIEVGNCDSFNCFPLDLFPKIKTLHIRGCRNLQSFSVTSSRHLIFPCQDIHIVDCAELSLSPLLQAQDIKTITLEDSNFILRFVRLPTKYFCLQISFLKNPAALQRKLMGVHASDVQEIEFRKGVKQLNLAKWFPEVKSFKVIEYPLSVMEMANPGDSTHLKSWEIVSHNDVAIFLKDEKPANNLTRLTLTNCRKLKSLPERMNDLFPCLANLELVKCTELTSFPENSQSLPSRLKMFQVKECINLSSLDISTVSSSLVTLKLADLQNLRSLHYKVLENLVNMEISDCPELYSVPQGICNHLPSLKDMSILLCPNLKSFLIGGFPSTFHSLDIRSCNKIADHIMNWDFRKLPKFSKLAIAKFEIVNSLPEERLFPSTLTSLILLQLTSLTSLQLKGLQHLTQLMIGSCMMLQNFPEYMQDLLPSLSNLTIYDCPLLESFKVGGLPSRLQGLYVWNCEQLIDGLMKDDLRRLPYLSLLKIGGHGRIESLPEDTLLPSTLTSLELCQLKQLKTLKLQHLTSLQHLIIRDCSQLSSLPGKLLDHHHPTISGCPKLKAIKKMASLRSRSSAGYSGNTP